MSGAGRGLHDGLCRADSQGTARATEERRGPDAGRKTPAGAGGHEKGTERDRGRNRERVTETERKKTD